MDHRSHSVSSRRRMCGAGESGDGSRDQAGQGGDRAPASGRWAQPERGAPGEHGSDGRIECRPNRDRQVTDRGGRRNQRGALWIYGPPHGTPKRTRRDREVADRPRRRHLVHLAVPARERGAVRAAHGGAHENPRSLFSRTRLCLLALPTQRGGIEPPLRSSRCRASASRTGRSL